MYLCPYFVVCLKKCIAGVSVTSRLILKVYLFCMYCLWISMCNNFKSLPVCVCIAYGYPCVTILKFTCLCLYCLWISMCNNFKSLPVCVCIAYGYPCVTILNCTVALVFFTPWQRLTRLMWGAFSHSAVTARVLLTQISTTAYSLVLMYTVE